MPIACTVLGIGDRRHRPAAAGIDVIEGIPIPDCNRFELRDPFGNRVAFIDVSEDNPA